MKSDASALPEPGDTGDRLLRRIQSAVPLDARPFASLGRDLGIGEAEVIERLRAQREQKVLREISAVLEGAALGYDSALATGVVPPEMLDRAVAAVNAHPTVTHNYLRDHRYNLWFTVAVPQEMSLDTTLRMLARESGVEAFHPLRRTRVYKIGVNFDPVSRTNRSEAKPTSAVPSIEVTERDARLFRALQSPLPLVERPFDELADAAGVAAEEILAFGRRHLGGAIRRYVGTLRHRILGVRANGMVVWRVPEDRIDALGARLAQAPEVSHCYARNPIAGFSYTLYSMVHGPDAASCRDVAARLSRETGIDDYAVLFSEREFKKTRLRYFLPELEAWWAARTG